MTINLILGSTSGIAKAWCRKQASLGNSFILIARDEEALKIQKADLIARGATKIDFFTHDLKDTSQADLKIQHFTSTIGFPDRVFLSYGILGEQNETEKSIEEISDNLITNFLSPVVWLQILANKISKPCQFIVLGSVAGDRGRASNYIYGAAKAGLAVFCNGLSHKSFNTNLRVLLVKPGFVKTQMTAHLNRESPLWASPEKIANDIDKAVLKKKTVLYTPWFWQIIMLVIMHMPKFAFNRMKF